MSDRWLTYVDAARALGLSVEGIRQRARREHWRKQLGNDGKALVLVPNDTTRLPAEQSPNDQAPNRPATARQPADNDVAELAVLRAKVTELESRAAELRSDLEREREQAARVQAELRADTNRERTERLAERDQATRLTDKVADLARQLATTVEEAAGRERDLQARLTLAEATLATIRTAPWWRRLIRA